jgi:hypothetical protein
MVARRKARSRRLARFLVVALLLYVAAAYGWPWVRARLGGTGGSPVAGNDDTGNAAALACIEQSQRAVDDFRKKVESQSTPGVELNWREAMRRNRVEREAALRACRCEAEACVAAADAMTELAEAAQSFEVTVLDGGTPHDVSSRLARMQEQLGAARARLRTDS